MSPKIKHIIWDWNGTLIDDAWLFVEIMNGELKDRDLPLINVQDYRKYFTFPVKKYYENLGFDFQKESFKEVGYNFIQKFKKRKFEAKLFNESLKILDFIHNLGIGQSIVSAQEHNLLNQTIKYYKIEHYFEYIAGIEHYYADNKTQIAKTVRKKIPFKNNEILMIGDSAHDSEVAHKLEIKCILFSKGHYSKKRLLNCNNQIIDHHIQLQKILTKVLSV
jgi:phosphoglycolate phosphatase